jgi:elongation factor Ts
MASEIDDIKWLRENTGAGIMECKRALQDSGGDREKSVKLLEQRGQDSAAKRAGKATGAGLVEPYIHHGGQIGVLVEMDSETDFVARMPEFKELAREIAMQVAAHQPRYLSLDEVAEADATEMKERFRQEAIKEGKPEAIAGNIAEGRFKKYASEIVLLEQPYIRDGSKKIKDLVDELGARTKENVVVRRFTRYQVGL